MIDDYQDRVENFTDYPLSRRQAFRMFKVPIHYATQKVYQASLSSNTIDDNLAQMSDYGYNFKFNFQKKGFYKNQPRKNMRRKVKAKFICHKCQHKFTSILGNFQVAFWIDYPNFKNTIKTKRISSEYLGLVRYDLRLYKMMCEKCRKFCDGAIYESQLKAVAKSFCIVLAQIFDDAPRPIHNDDRYKMDKEMHHHRAQLCQACKKGVCFNRDKTATQIKQNTDDVDHSSEDQIRFDNFQSKKKNQRYEFDRRKNKMVEKQKTETDKINYHRTKDADKYSFQREHTNFYRRNKQIKEQQRKDENRYGEISRKEIIESKVLHNQKEERNRGFLTQKNQPNQNFHPIPPTPQSCFTIMNQRLSKTLNTLYNRAITKLHNLNFSSQSRSKTATSNLNFQTTTKIEPQTQKKNQTIVSSTSSKNQNSTLTQKEQKDIKNQTDNNKDKPSNCSIY